MLNQSLLNQSKIKFHKILKKNNLIDSEISIYANPLTPEQAIGNPERRDYPIIEGKERVIEANFLSSKGHAFTDSPLDYNGKLFEILEINLDSNQNRAIYVATINAVFNHLNIVNDTVHCKDEEPEKCAVKIAEQIAQNKKVKTVGLIGLNPAIAENLIKTFGKENILISDLNKENIGKNKFAVNILDGKTMTEELISKSDFILATGTTLINNTIDDILFYINKYNRNYLFYGVTIAGINELFRVNRICPFARSY